MLSGVLYAATPTPRTRQAVVDAAQAFADVAVTLSTANLLNATTSQASPTVRCDSRLGIRANLDFSLCENVVMVGEAYKWFGADSTSTYTTNVAAGKKVIMPKSATDDPGFAGLDCSGLVFRSWGLSGSKINTAGLAAKTIDVAWGDMKKGDIFLNWNDPNDLNHAALLKADLVGTTLATANIIHATWSHFPSFQTSAYRAVNDASVPILQNNAGVRRLQGFKPTMYPRTAFPIVSSFSPATGEIVGSSSPVVAITLRSATDIDVATITLAIDGLAVATSSIVPSQNFPGVGQQVSVSSAIVRILADGVHSIAITAQNQANLIDTIYSTFTVDTSLPDIDPEDPPRNPLSPVVPSSHCVVGVVSSGPSGVRSVTIEGPSGFSKTATYSCVHRSTFVAYGPHCGLPAGEYTITAESCSGMIQRTTMTVSAVTNTIRVRVSSSVGNAAEISQYLGLYGEMRVESCVVNMGSDCLWCTQSVYDHTTLQGGGSHSQFCGGHSGASGNMCCQRLAYSAVGPQEFSIVNLGTGTASYSLSVMAQACKDDCGPNAGAVSSTMTAINAGNGGGISGHVEVAQFGKISSQSSGGICSAGSSIGGVTVTTQPCTGILNYLIQVLFPSTKCCVIEGSEVVFTSTMPISFQFEDSAGGVATDTTTLAIYQFDGAIWSSSTITNQAVTKSTTTGVITASGEYLRSGLFGAFFQPVDSSAPITTLSFQGSTHSFLTTVFVATSAYIVLSSTDPSVNGYASQLATTYYRLDATTTTAPFFAYSSSIPASLGFHILEYRAVDYAGNLESIKTSTFVVTSGSVAKASNRLTSKGRALIGYSDSGAQLEVEARAQDSLTVRISSPSAGSMLTVDNVGLVGLGEMSYGAARLDVQPPATGDVALGLRSGNSIASTSSVQVAFGYNGSTYMRHALVTTHSTGTVGNRMDFYIWNPLAPSTAAVAAMDVLALQASTNSSGGVMHVRPAGNPVLGVELVVSDGSTIGGGKVIRGTAATHSARRLKSDIKDLSAAERAQAVRDLRALSHVRYNYRSEPLGARPHTGVLFEEAPASIRGPGGTISLDRRVLNAEESFKDAILRLEKLQGRLKKLEEGR